MQHAHSSVSPRPTLYIQQVTIWWTKASRGMPQAQVRAQVPHTYPLAPEELRELGTGGIHRLTLREEEGFAPHGEVHALPSITRITVGAVTFEPTATGVHLRYRYNSMLGAPDRSHRPPIALDVVRGRRVRIAYNGRFSGYSIEWLYKLEVITVTVGIPLSADLFTVAPDHTLEDLAELF